MLIPAKFANVIWSKLSNIYVLSFNFKYYVYYHSIIKYYVYYHSIIKYMCIII